MGTAHDVGLVTGVLSLAREPARLTLLLWERGFSGAAAAARLGLELLDPGRAGRDGSPDRERARSSFGNGGPPDVESAAAGGVETGGPAEPEAVVPETGYIAPEPGEFGPEPDVVEVEQPADSPPAVPDDLIPDHVDEEVVLVAETAEEGAEEGVGPEIQIDEPWEGYDGMTPAEIGDRLAAATPELAAAVELYESAAKDRRSVLEAAQRALKS
jgi:hypothetical protein